LKQNKELEKNMGHNIYELCMEIITLVMEIKKVLVLISPTPFFISPKNWGDF